VLRLASEGLESIHCWDLDLLGGTNGRASSDKGEKERSAREGEVGVHGRGWPSVKGQQPVERQGKERRREACDLSICIYSFNL
jgi:hypothetical protein